MKQQTSRLLSTTTLSLAVGGLMMLSPTAPCGIGSGQVGVSFGGVAMAACNPCNPCNPCAATNPCNPCAALKKPVNACNPCNPCAAANPCNPCNPCAAANPCNPCNPCAAN